MQQTHSNGGMNYFAKKKMFDYLPGARPQRERSTCADVSIENAEGYRVEFAARK